MSSLRMPTQVLHNMSCQPQSQIRYDNASIGQTYRFSITGLPLPQSIRERAGLETRKVFLDPDDTNNPEVLAYLEQLSHDCPDLAKLPPIAAVAGAVSSTTTIRCRCLRLVAGVLTRSNYRVFMRDRSPIATASSLSRELTLLLPANLEVPTCLKST